MSEIVQEEAGSENSESNVEIAEKIPPEKIISDESNEIQEDADSGASEEEIDDETGLPPSSSVKKKRKRLRSSEQHRYCSYCYERTSRNEMLKVPRQPDRIKLWTEILGPQFECYLKHKKNKFPLICRKHFRPCDLIIGPKLTRVFFTALPQRDEQYEGREYPTSHYRKPKPVTEEKRRYGICIYCSKRNYDENMRIVTRTGPIREMWCRRLGETFRANIEKRKWQKICKEHFPGYVREDGKMPSFVLPVKMDNERISIHDEDNCISGQYGFKCVYCYEIEFSENMVLVPGGIYRDIWIEILGERFGENLNIMPRSFICATHFAVRPNGKKYGIPYPMADPNIDEGKMKELDANSLRLREKYPRFTCSYCSESRLKDEMINPALNGFRLDVWCEQLGYKFEHNVFMTNEIWLCIWHFYPRDFLHNRLRSSAVPREFSNRMPKLGEKKVEKKEKPPSDLRTPSDEKAFFRECAYCHWTGKLRFMRRVVECPNKFRKWVEILGEEFELNCWKYEEPAICRAHFESTRNDADLPEPIDKRWADLLYSEDPSNQKKEKTIRDSRLTDEVKYEIDSESDSEEMYAMQWEEEQEKMDALYMSEGPQADEGRVKNEPESEAEAEAEEGESHRFEQPLTSAKLPSEGAVKDEKTSPVKLRLPGEFRIAEQMDHEITKNVKSIKKNPVTRMTHHKPPKTGMLPPRKINRNQPAVRDSCINEIEYLSYALLDHTYASYHIITTTPPQIFMRYKMPTSRIIYAGNLG